ncbi:MAG TPA: DUF6049 family protein [Mycobacteriales bacterium]|nr:DUF6049 family protein [Mycobacteriales bacterium]
MVLLAAPLGLTATAQRAEAQDDSGEPLPVQVAVEEMSSFLTPDGVLTLRARLLSNSSETLDKVQVRLRVGDAVGSRSELQQLARTPPTDNDFVTVNDLAEDAGVPDELSPGDVATLDLRLPADDPRVRRLFDDRNGVHPLRIEVRARSGTSNRTRVGVADTFMPWWPEPTERTRVAWLWPLTADDARGPGGRLTDDTLAGELEDGRLALLVDVAQAAAARTPVTWVIDPALVENVEAMADGYLVRRDDGSTSEGSGQAAAAAWLASARTALGNPRGRTLALPYADPDITALTRAGQRDVVSIALQTGRQVLADSGFANVASRLAWPPGGAVDVATLGVLAAAGARDVIVSASTLQADDTVDNATPSAATELNGVAPGAVTAVATDAELSRLVAEGPAAGGTAEGTRLALQRVLAETAFFTLERPSQSRDLVIAPPRRWNPARPFAAGLLDLSAGVPWLQPDVVTNVATRPRDDIDRFVAFSGADRERELPLAVLTAARVERDRVERYRSILAPAGDASVDLLPDRLERALLRAASSRYRNDVTAARSLVGDIRDVLGEQFAKVSVAGGGLITMGGDTARLPITLVNDLGTTVRVQVRIDSRNRLSLPDGEVRTEVVAPGRRQLQISARALVPGDFTITVSLATPDGRPLPGEPTLLRVRSSAYGKVALAITIGAFVLLLLGSVTRLARRRRRVADREPA